MKKTLLISILLAISIVQIQSFAYEVTYAIEFNLDDFNLNPDEEGAILIESDKQNCLYVDSLASGLPMVQKMVAIPYESSLLDFEVLEGPMRLIQEDIVLRSFPTPSPTSSLNELPKDTQDDALQMSNFVEDGIYPITNFSVLKTYDINGVPVINFSICPFKYDTNSKKLFFINQFSIKFNLKFGGNGTFITDNIEETRKLVKSLVINPNEVDEIIDELPFKSDEYEEVIKYVIITNDELAPSFNSLLTWKRAKGNYAKLVTISDIEKLYEGNDLVYKIKRYLYDLYVNNGLKFAILGGDVNIVPSRKCKVSTAGYTTNDMPSDKYYACFGGPFSWDGNGNGIYGEFDDYINYSENIYISRIPVETEDDAEAYINKLILYEMGTHGNQWPMTMLTMGVKLGVYFDNISDAEYLGNLIHKDVVSKLWNGNRFKFYDTGTSYNVGAAYDLNRINLSKELSKGNMFVSMMTHGSETRWVLENSESFYSGDAADYSAYGFSFITTTACYTNAFDYKNGPCLSEGFIRGEDNGVVGYWGSSRYGWYSKGSKSLTYSSLYESKFYEYLFGSEIEEKNFSKITSLAKKELEPKSYSNSTYHWLQLSLNTMGDAETPIYINRPIEFDEIEISFLDDNNLSISTAVDGCRICIMDLDSSGMDYYKVFEGVSSAYFSEIPTLASVVITKQGYKPYLYIIDKERGKGFEGNEEGPLNIGEVSNNDNVLNVLCKNNKSNSIGLNLSSDKGKINKCYANRASGIINLEIEDSEGSLKNIVVTDILGVPVLQIQMKESSLKESINNLPKGIYTVSLIIDNNIVDSRKVIL